MPSVTVTVGKKPFRGAVIISRKPFRIPVSDFLYSRKKPFFADTVVSGEVNKFLLIGIAWSLTGKAISATAMGIFWGIVLETVQDFVIDLFVLISIAGLFVFGSMTG